MKRPLLADAKIAPKALEAMIQFHPEVISEVSEAVARDSIVVVGMAQNPFVGKACRALREARLTFTYLEYGSYISKWKQRLAIKLWSGWPTFPQIFVQGRLMGGYADILQLLQSGELQKQLNQKRT